MTAMKTFRTTPNGPITRYAALPRISTSTTGSKTTILLHFYGYVSIPEDGNYTFSTRSDDGSLLYIGDKLIVDNNGPHGAETQSGSVLMRAGLHRIHVTYSELYGGEELSVTYSSNTIPAQKIPDNQLFRELLEITTPPDVSLKVPRAGLKGFVGSRHFVPGNVERPGKSSLQSCLLCQRPVNW
ncbi:MAG: hypothetical protein HC896_11140 [Bacteroidales bacterium]|nr:hypothetical protein [Bacteroidales bacterium]